MMNRILRTAPFRSAKYGVIRRPVEKPVETPYFADLAPSIADFRPSIADYFP